MRYLIDLGRNALRRWVAGAKSQETAGTVRVDIDVLVPGITRLRLTGRLDMACAPAFRRTLQSVIQHTPKGLMVSLAELGWIDSSGLAVLIEGLRWSHQRGITFTLAHPTPEVQMALELARLENLFAIARSDDAEPDVAASHTGR